MKHKSFMLLILAAVMICLGACGNTGNFVKASSLSADSTNLSPAEKYLSITSDEDLFNEFEKACYIGTAGIMGFAKVSDISSDDLYRFANMTVDLETQNRWFQDTDQKFHIPLSDITALLDKYFEGYTFVPNGIKYISYYDEEKKELVATALGGEMGAWSSFLVSKKAIGDDLIKVQLQDKYTPDYMITITAKVTDTGIKFLSCISEKLQMPGGLSIFDDQELTDVRKSMEECNAFFGEPSDVKETDTGNGNSIYICTYKNAVCEFISCSVGNGKMASYMREMDVTSPDYSPLRGIHIGDSLDAVIAKFPDTGKAKYEQSGEAVKPLYGDYENGQFFTYGCVFYQGTQPVRAEVCNDEWRVLFIFDNHQCISSIQIKSTAMG